MSRSYDESMSSLSSLLERYPGALVLGRTDSNWLASVTVHVPYAGPDGEANSPWAGSRPVTVTSRSCESEKVLDSLVDKLANLELLAGAS